MSSRDMESKRQGKPKTVELSKYAVAYLEMWKGGAQGGGTEGPERGA